MNGWLMAAFHPLQALEYTHSPHPVSAGSERFRMRAKQCRELAAVARDDYSRQTLTQMAVELDAKADAIEAGEGPEMPLSPVSL